mgnify:CR=1 FL=1
MYNSAINQIRPGATVASQRKGLSGYNSLGNGFQELLDNARIRSTNEKFNSSSFTSWTNPLFPDSTGVSPTANITNFTPVGEKYQYNIEKVGEIERAPHAMFEHNGELVMSAISRNGISHSPIYTYSDENGLQKRGQLPDSNESGNYGFSFDDGLHIVAESWKGMIDYVAQSPDGPWVKHDYTH